MSCLAKTVSAVLALLVAPLGLVGSGCSAAARQIEATYTADLDGTGRNMEILYFQCRVEAGQRGESPDHVLGVTIREANPPHVTMAEWTAPPTPINAFYPDGNRLIQDPESKEKLIISTVQYGGKVVALYLFRFNGLKLVQGGRWVGANVQAIVRNGFLTLLVYDPNSTILPALLVWSGGCFTPAGSRFAALYRALGDDHVRSISSSKPVAPWWLFLDCKLALQAYSKAGRVGLGERACQTAQERLSTRRLLQPYFPSEGAAQFEREIADAMTSITKTLDESRNGRSHGRSSAGRDFDASSYLPPGSTIADPRKDVIFADVDGDKVSEVIIFYLRPDGHDLKPAILILKRHERGYALFWEKMFDGGHGFLARTGVSDLTRSGVPQIVAYRSVGASCDSQLDIYAYRSGDIRRVVQWDTGACQAFLEFKDLDGDGIPEIIFATTNYGSIPDVYRWNGEEWALSNTRFPRYYDGEAKKLLAEAYSGESVPVSWRMASVNQIVQIYSIQKRFAEIISMCKKVLVTIDNPALTSPNAKTPRNAGAKVEATIGASFRHDKAQAKAALYRVEGNAFQSMGNEREAKNLYEEAAKLEANRSVLK